MAYAFTIFYQLALSSQFIRLSASWSKRTAMSSCLSVAAVVRSVGSASLPVEWQLASGSLTAKFLSRSVLAYSYSWPFSRLGHYGIFQYKWSLFGTLKRRKYYPRLYDMYGDASSQKWPFFGEAYTDRSPYGGEKSPLNT